MAGNLYEKELSEEAMDLHRAISSLIEELEAVDYYNQRAEITKDEELKKIMEHNRDEEKEHAAMLIEYLRRKDLTFEKELKEFLFTEGSITELEEG
ncbi:MAG: ferritin [Caldisericaceae bacterium]|jgi:ferritin-like protein|nr:ferritin [Caldisericaceae bacterium]